MLSISARMFRDVTPGSLLNSAYTVRTSHCHKEAVIGTPSNVLLGLRSIARP
jgi:hypothetical protein